MSRMVAFFMGNPVHMSNEASRQAVDQLFELKSSSLTVPVLRLLGGDMERVAAELEKKVAQTPDFFRNAPIVIDLARFASDSTVVDLPLLVGLIRGLGMLPIGVQGANAEQQETAQVLELAALGNGTDGARRVPQPPRQPVAPPANGKSMLVTRPVRSGQRIYARGGDLIVTAAVSSGAEVFADGNVHVYGALRGRAMAGIGGDRNARIFCRELGAELVAIAGRYRVNENLDPALLGRSVQIYLQQDKLVVEPA